MRKIRLRAFTLIELLIVVAIISVLAAIAVPNFLEAQVRSKVARVAADQRSMATALESYAVDNNTYPVRHDNWATGSGFKAYPPLNSKIYDPSYPTAQVGLHVLTTPIPYIAAIPKDVFNLPARSLATPTNRELDAIDFWDPTQVDIWLSIRKGSMTLQSGIGRGWALVSVGPDQYIGVNAAGNPGGYPPEPYNTQYTGYYMYDPTNGTISTGNLYRFSGQLSAAYIFSPP
jgi:prepilin-type N-terminal cleavage/methylation domain-containing protein